jgi:hypothetical protein
MNQVDIYIDNKRLDLFEDEQISINLIAQNYKDPAKVHTDFTQSFTVPASRANNAIFKHYYRVDVFGGFDARLRQDSRIEINSLPFRTGVVQLESIEMHNTQPYAYSLTFYGDVVNLADLFGEDYLYDLDLSDLDHDYDGATIQSGFSQDALEGGNVFYPLMSPVRNWVYNVGNSSPAHDDDIYYDTAGGHHHGINYYELKPAIKVTKILEAIEDKYGIVLTGSFLSTSPFTKLFLWAHRYEGYMYEGQPTAMAYEKVNFNHTAAPTPDYFDLTTDTFTPEGVTGSGDIYDIYFDVDIPAYTDDYYLAVIKNGVVISEQLLNGAQTGTFEDIPITNYFDSVHIGIKPTTNAPMVYQFYQCTFTRNTGSQLQADVDQTLTATYQGATVEVSSLMPEIKVADFLAGIIKMHNLVMIPSTPTYFTLYTLDDWYAAGVNRNYQSYIDDKAIDIRVPELNRRIEFKYQDTEQILGYEYRRANATGYGDLRADFNFDGDELKVELPFESALFERLYNYGQHGGTTAGLSNVLVYKSQTREFDTDFENRLQKYVGSPILIYGEFSLDISANPLGFIDENGTLQPSVDEVWYANTSSTSIGTGLAYSINWGADIDPFYLTSVNKSLYQTYWQDYIEDLYSTNRRVYYLDAILPIGEILKLDLNDKLIWNNTKWIINSVQLNLTTGKAKLELLNDIQPAPVPIGPEPEPSEGPTPA